MHDPREIAADPERFRAGLARRGGDASSQEAVDHIVSLSEQRTALVQAADADRAARNEASKSIGGLMREGRREEAEAAKSEVAAIKARIEASESQLGAIEAALRDAALRLPNLLDGDVPAGASDADNQEIARWGTPAELGFEAEGHVELGERLGILDMERAAKLTGARFYVLTGLGARLERALVNLFLDLHTGKHGYTEAVVPYLVHDRIAEGTGQLPKFAEDMFQLADDLNGSRTYLIPTAEVPLTNLHRDEILDEAQLPVQYAAFTPCFRSEAGSAGRDTRGMLRVHQFHKVELVHLTADGDSARAHEALVGHAEACLQALELPYRKMLLCTGDTGFSAQRCYDLEVWMPSQGTYREVSSCSNTGPFQARRMNLRYRPSPVEGKKQKPRFCHTLNGSGLATGRALIAVLENGQQADGSVRLPAALVPYMGGIEVLTPPVPR